MIDADRIEGRIQPVYADTLPRVPIDILAVLRLDGDMYESTMVPSITCMHNFLKAGFALLMIMTWRTASTQFLFFEKNNIAYEMVPIDWTGMYCKYKFLSE